MSISRARTLAFDILRAVETKEAHAGDLLHERLDAKIKPQDAALATELTLGVLRWQGLLDFLAEQHTKTPTSELDPEVRIALRLGLYQLRYLSRVPARAAVNESVELVKRARKKSAAGLVNAVLRRLAESAREPIEPLLPSGLSAAERLAILHSHPAWLVERWLERFGESRTIALLEANNRAPRMVVAVHATADTAAVAAELQGSGMKVGPGQWLRSALVVEGGAAGLAIARSTAYRSGKISIQDEASRMIPLLLDARPGQRVLDLCSAPGGKTISLALAVGPSGRVVAADIHPERLRSVEEQAGRVGLKNVEVAALDATQPLPFREKFDRVLVDAPCSGTGTLGRNPEIRWRLRPEGLADFRRRQVALLENASVVLAPGGVLVYATCSLEPEENEEVVSEFLASHPDVRRANAGEFLAGNLVEPGGVGRLVDAEGCFRTFPPEHQTDGFYGAVLGRE